MTMNQPFSFTQLRASLALSALAIAALAACSTVPDRNPALEQARSHLQTVRTQSQVATLAPAELQRAADALARADQAHASGAVLAQVDHLAYLTEQRINIAQETAADRASVAITASAGAERDRMRLAQRTQEADTAQTQLAASAGCRFP